MSDKIFHLIIIVVAGVILADFVAHADGTSALLGGVGMLFNIGTNPTRVSNIKTIKSTPVANTGSMAI